MKENVKVWEEDILLPTYGIGRPEKNPMFLEKRVYQGSSGVVYPYPVIEKIEDTCEEKSYHAVWLENEYLKVMILPELGGRIQMAFDKIKQRHFIYYNHVIKPALVGLTGPWISGGIEFNWPQHHRPSTFLPVDYSIEQCKDGSVIVWVSERERMFGQKGTAGFTLRPGRAVLEIQGKVSNPTPLPQTFLWWANPAVAVNADYQSVFPSDVNAVFDHGKRDVSRYPIATGTYYKMDYSAGVDISRYKNIPVPTSYMAIRSEYNFVGGYENDTQAGVLHVANHHISPGKKQWTWGNGDFGQAWDRNLTDADGPYIELMTGVYTDNQPDFSWLQPYEEKTFTQYFMPYRELGVVKNASSELLMNLEPEGTESRLKLFATSAQQGLHIVVRKAGKICFEQTCDLSPEQVFDRLVPVNDLSETEVIIYGTNGREKLSWRAEPETIKEVPEAGARTAMLQTGEADFIYPTPSDQIEAIKGTDDVNILTTDSNIMRYVTLNMDLEQLSDVKVRQAMNYAIDKDAYIQLMYSGYGKPATSVVPSIIGGYEEQEAYTYDVDKAKELMKEAGYEDGFKLTLWGDNTTQEIKGMTFISQQLAQIGIEVDVQPMEPATVSDKIYVDKEDAEINMWYVNWSASDFTMDGSLRSLLYSTMCPPTSANTAYFNDADFDKDMDEGLATANEEEQAKYYSDAQKIAWEACPWLFLGNDQIIYSTKSYLSGVYVSPDGAFNFANATLAQ